MTLQIGTKSIERVWLIDDEAAVRATYEDSVEDLKVIAVNESGPLPELDIFARSFKADAAICDHHLRPHNYAHFDGATLVAKWYELQFPAILCTKVEGAIDEIRPHRRGIPVLLKEPGLNPEVIRAGFEKCIAEFRGQFSSTRRPWRTLVRVVDVDKITTTRTVFVVIPAWDSTREIRLLLKELPDEIQGVVNSSTRLHAMVNIGAENYEDLYFENWETS